MKFKNIAFTLAETLVVMGIIGVIAALTIPNLSQSTGNKEKITRIQKAYSNLVEAIDRATAIYGLYDNWGLTNNRTHDDNFVGDRITEFMKLSKNCRDDSTCATYAANYPYYHFTLADGTYMSFCPSLEKLAFDIIIVKHGEKGMRGKNSFRGTFILENGEFKHLGLDMPFDSLKTAVTSCATNPSNTITSTYNNQTFYNCPDGALIWIIKYGNMDYLKFTSEGKCPNGNEPTESNPRCN